MNENNNNLDKDKSIPMVTKKINGMTYLVSVHFSESSKENLADKIKRMILSEVKSK